MNNEQIYVLFWYNVTSFKTCLHDLQITDDYVRLILISPVVPQSSGKDFQ